MKIGKVDGIVFLMEGLADHFRSNGRTFLYWIVRYAIRSDQQDGLLVSNIERSYHKTITTV